MRTRWSCGLTGSLWLFVALSAQAQFSADYQTNVVSGVVSNWSGDYIVGSNTIFNSLRIDSAGTLSNASAYIGYTASASNNSALIDGIGSVWSNTGTLTVGYGSAGNSLTVNDGGAVVADNLIVGQQSGSQGELSIVSGSVLVARLRLGNSLGSFGQLFATNASVTATNDILIGSAGAGSMYVSNSTVTAGGLAVSFGGGSGTLTACDSVLTIPSGLSLGWGSNGTGTVWITRGQLSVTNGPTTISFLSPGQMICSNSLVNLATLSVGMSGNNIGTLTVSGGSLFSRQFAIGSGGGSSTGAVWICDGATVTATNDESFIGESGIGTMIVSNSTVRLAALTLAKYFLVDTFGTLTVAGGTVSLSGTLTLAGQGNQFASSHASIWLNGGQFLATNAPVYLGYGGHGELTISNGTASARGITLGTLAGSQGTLTVAGGTLNVAGDWLRIGNQGSGELNISSGTVNIASMRIAGKIGSAGTIHVSGGLLIVSGSMIFGEEPGPTAHVWITGGQMTSLGSELHIEGWCDGLLTISNGSFETPIMHIGNGNVGTVTVAGGRLNVNILELATSTNATVWLTGGEVNTIGLVLRGSSTMVISNGIAQAWRAGVGWGLTNSSLLSLVGGNLNVDEDLYVGSDHSSTDPPVPGFVEVAGGTLYITNTLSIGGRDLLDSRGGTGQMTVSAGSVNVNTLLIGTLSEAAAQLTLTGGLAVARSACIIGRTDCDTTATVVIAGGEFLVTNSSHSAVLDVRSGTLAMSGGTVIADKFVLTNSCGHFIRTGGTLIAGTILLDPNRDDDGDGIPNGYEQSHGLDPLNADDAGSDDDGDGQSNLQEYQAGTDPTNSASAFQILSVVPTNDDVLVTWATAGGRTNVVQSAPDLAGGYTSISPNIILPGSGETTTNYLDAGSATNSSPRFYKIRLVP